MKKPMKIAMSTMMAMTVVAPLQMTSAATTTVAATQSPIKHVVVIYQENHSFDNYFGTYPSAPGFNSLPNTPAVNGIPAGSYNLDGNGNKVAPYLFQSNQLQTMDVDHGYNDMIKAYDNGKMDQFYAVNEAKKAGEGLISMGHYDYNAIPAYWQYAQHFAMADNWFQPVFGPSTPGALYLVAAQSGTKDQPISGDPTPKNNFGGDTYSGLTYNLTYKNIGDELTSAGDSWAWYQGGYAAKDATYSSHHNPFQYFQGFEDGTYKNNLKDANEFAKDVTNGNLPQVTFLKADYPEDEHPGYSTPSGEDFAVKAINEIMNSPYWKDTAIVITYDESGGYWDHVAPPQVTPGPDGLQGDGPRIPAMVISPYAKENYVSHVQYDTTSILKFIEWNFNLPALNNRDANASNITDMFDFNHPSFAPYMFNDGSQKSTSSYGKTVNVKINNALMGVSNTKETPFVDAKGNVMVPLVDFARSINGKAWMDNKGQVGATLEGHQIRFDGKSKNVIVDGQPVSSVESTWMSPTYHTYVPLQTLVNILGWTMSTNNDGSIQVLSK